jgi:hypothetical protein
LGFESTDLFHSRSLRFRDHVAVQLQRRLDVGVSKLLLQNGQRRRGLYQLGRKAVTKGVEPDVRLAAILGEGQRKPYSEKHQQKPLSATQSSARIAHRAGS